MSIIEHPTIRYTHPVKGYSAPTYVAQCDLCKTMCSHTGTEPGDAAEQAHKRAWATQKAPKAQIGDPKIWVCKGCLKVQQK